MGSVWAFCKHMSHTNSSSSEPKPTHWLCAQLWQEVHWTQQSSDHFSYSFAQNKQMVVCSVSFCYTSAAMRFRWLEGFLSFLHSLIIAVSFLLLKKTVSQYSHLDITTGSCDGSSSCISLYGDKGIIICKVYTDLKLIFYYFKSSSLHWHTSLGK